MQSAIEGKGDTRIMGAPSRSSSAAGGVNHASW